MKIVFYAGASIPIHAHSLEQRPLGGTETGLIRVAEILEQRGYEVTVFTAHKTPPASKPRYLPSNSLNEGFSCDVYIAVQEWMAIFAPVRCRQIMYWTGDGSEQFLNFGLGDRRSREKIDLLLTASTWHREDLCRASGFPIKKTFVVGNGVHLPFYEKGFARNRKRLIYTSAPYRGLALVPQLYSELLSRIADLELTVISGFEIYDRDLPFQGAELQGTKEILSRLQMLSGCVVKRNMTQRQLAEEYLQAGLFFYPNTARETCCITALEAQAAGCPVVTSRLGALEETVGDGGIVISGEPGSSQYNHDFLEAAERLLSDQDYWQKFSNCAQKRIRENYSWERVADRFEEAFRLKSVHTGTEAE